ncbi:TPA: endonuclease [Candidatus Uhrbacteria bacterium]|nr:endonuclease [Candidatus Uhrbacteria bacterium]
MITVYALLSEFDGTLYIGMCKDLDRRLSEHNSGRNRSTKHKRPFRVILTETHPDFIVGRIREKWLKSGEGRRYIKQHAGIV